MNTQQPLKNVSRSQTGVYRICYNETIKLKELSTIHFEKIANEEKMYSNPRELKIRRLVDGQHRLVWCALTNHRDILR